MKCTAPAARKLLKDAEAAGLKATVSDEDTTAPMTVIAVRSADGKSAMIAEWWTNLREFNYAATITTGERQSKRAPSLRAARQHVGLA